MVSVWPRCQRGQFVGSEGSIKTGCKFKIRTKKNKKKNWTN